MKIKDRTEHAMQKNQTNLVQFGMGDTRVKYQFLDYHWLFSRTIQEGLLAQYLEQTGQVACRFIWNSFVEFIENICSKKQK